MAELKMTESRFAERLLDSLVALGNFPADMDDGLTGRVQDVQTFKEVHILTMNAGVVIKTMDCCEWQLTIVRSKG